MKKGLGWLLVLVFCVSMVGVSAGAVKKAKVVKKVLLKKVEIKQFAKPAAPKKEEMAPALTEQKLQDVLGDYKEEVNLGFAKLKEQVDKVSSDNSDAKVSGTIFFRFQQPQSSGSTPNFDVDRAYVNITKKLGADALARITLDIVRLDTTTLDASKKSQNSFEYLKYAYVDMPITAASSLFSPLSLGLRLGLQQTVWIDWADKILNLRFVAKNLVDNEGVMSSSDFGVSALGKVSLAKLPEVEYHTAWQNGAGYKSAETDNKKNVSVRLNSTIYQNETFGSIIIGGFGNVTGLTSSGTDSKSTKQAGALVAYKHDQGTVYAEYLYGTKIMGYSIGGIYNFFPAFNVFARADRYDPDRSKDKNELDRAFYGIIYDWGKDVRLALDMQTVTGGSAASTSAGKTTSVLYLHTLVNI